ncbi:MAG: glycosyltransferase family 9 protein [Chloroflexi bacterium]|nr:MAG: glycosyltransferase family 9 protein [Chloroflexota bacterium]
MGSRQRLRLGLLHLFARLSRGWQGGLAQRPTAAPDAILVIRPDHLGDLLFTTPALSHLRQRHPEARITALVGPWGEPVLANHPDLDAVWTLPFPGFTRRPKPSPWQPYRLLIQAARRLRRHRFGMALVLRFDHWWGALLAYLAGIPHRIGYAVPEVAPFLTQALPYRPGRHEVLQNLTLVGAEGEGGWERWPLRFPVRAEDGAWAEARFGGERPIAIHPGAGAPVKRWRVEGWAQVADGLARLTGAPMVLTGTAGERSLCEAVAAQTRSRPVVLAGETTLGQLAALFARCRLVLGPDSGPLHLAVAVGTPTLHLYGPVDVATFGPWGPPDRHRVLVSAWPCVPCNRLDYPPERVDHHPCLREIRPEAVLAAARDLLQG